MKSRLQKDFERIANDYLYEFSIREDLGFEHWVGNDVGGVACFGDYYFTLDDAAKEFGITPSNT